MRSRDWSSDVCSSDLLFQLLVGGFQDFATVLGTRVDRFLPFSRQILDRLFGYDIIGAIVVVICVRVTHARLSIRVAHGKGRAAAVDLSGKSGHFLQLAQIAEAAALLAVAHDLRAMPIETRNSVEFCGAGGIDVGGGIGGAWCGEGECMYVY